MEKRGRGRPRSVITLHKRTVSFPPGLYSRLEEIALHEERTVNDLIVTELRESVRKRDAEKERGNNEAQSIAA